MQKTFGYELEFKGAILQELARKYDIPFYKKQAIVPYNIYHLKNETSISKICNPNGDLIEGGELISPILNNYDKCLNDLKFLLNVLKKKAHILIPIH